MFRQLDEADWLNPSWLSRPYSRS